MFVTRQGCVALLVVCFNPLGAFATGVAPNVGTTGSGLVGSQQLEATTESGGALGPDGRLRDRIPLELQPARGRVQPDLAIEYDGAGDGLLGVGWHLSVPHISVREMRRRPTSSSDINNNGKWTTTEYTYHSGGGAVSKLVEVAPNIFRAALEYRYLELRYDPGPSTWTVWDLDGTRFVFGARLLDGQEAVRWSLTRIVDVHNNATEFAWEEPGTSGCTFASSTSLRLAFVAYNQHAPSSGCPTSGFKDVVEFVYRARSTDALVARLGSVERVESLLHEIRVTSQDGSLAHKRLRTYHLRYSQSAGAMRPRLYRINLSGFECLESFPNLSATPTETLNCPPEALLVPTTFHYADGPAGFSAVPTEITRDQGEPMPYTIESETTAFADLDGDGRKDLLQAYTGGSKVLRWYPRVPSLDASAPFDAGFGNVATGVIREPLRHMLDFNGDGLPDLVEDETQTNPANPPQPTDQWQVHIGTGGAFNAPLLWDASGPAQYAHQSFPGSTNERQCIGRSLTCSMTGEIYTVPGPGLFDPDRQKQSTIDLTATFDLTGDGVPDYIVVDASTGGWSWLVFPGYVLPPSARTQALGGFSPHPIVWRFDGAPSQISEWPFLAIAEAVFSEIPGTPGFNVTLHNKMIDLNGDGLLDMYYVGASAWLNHGRGFTRMDWVSPHGHEGLYRQNDGSGTVQASEIIDVTGDGIPDLLFNGPGTYGEAIFLAAGTGMGFAATTETWLEAPSYDPQRPFPVLRWDTGQTRGLVDVNSDGLPDYVHPSQGVWYTYLNYAPAGSAFRQNQLIAKWNGRGLEIEYDYVLSTDLTNEHLPLVLSLVSAIRPMVSNVSSGASSIDWQGGAFAEDPVNGEWAFRGFALKTETDSGGGRLETRYPVGDPARYALPDQMQRFDDAGELFQTASYVWDVRPHPTLTGVVQVQLTKEKTTTVEPGSPAGHALETSKELLQYDGFGLPEAKVDYGDLSRSDDDIYTITEYARSSSSMVKGRPSLVKTCLDPQCADVRRVASFRYDAGIEDLTSEDGEPLPLHQINIGELSELRVYDPNVTGAEQVRLYAYDDLGNRTQSATMIDGTNGRVVTTDFDTTFALFPEVVTKGLNVVGGTQTPQPVTHWRTHDLALGAVTQEYAPDGTGAETLYDAFGRVRERALLSSNGDRKTLEEVTFDGHIIERKIHHDSATTTTRRTHLDARGRVVREERYLGADLGDDVEVEQVVEYDDRGRILSTAGPWLLSEGSTPPLTKHYYYDHQGRPAAQIVSPSLTAPALSTTTDVAAQVSVVRTAYDILADGRLIETWSPEACLTYPCGPSTREVRDAAGRRRELQDPAGNLIAFDYDALGNATDVRRTLELVPPFCELASDAGNGAPLTGPPPADDPPAPSPPCGTTVDVSVVATYDGLGRKTDLIDPDRGHLRFTYDGTGSLRTEEIADIRNPSLFDVRRSFGYDLSGRAASTTAERLISGVWQPAPDETVTYHYDDAAGTSHPDPSHLAGRLAFTTTAWGTTFHGYDSFGRQHVLARDFSVLSSQLKIQKELDRSGRTRRLLAGGANIAFDYSSAGVLSSVRSLDGSGAVDHEYYQVAVWHDARAPRELVRADGAVQELWDRDVADDRLTGIEVGSSGGPADIIALGFDAFDAVGRPTHVTDLLTTTSYEYSYDLSGRLETARATGGEQNFDFAYTYDSLGNLRQRKDVAGTNRTRSWFYRDDGVMPHAAVASVEDLLSAPGPVAKIGYNRGAITGDESCVGFFTGGCGLSRTMAYTTGLRLAQMTRVRPNGSVANQSFSYGAGGDLAVETHDHQGVSKTVLHVGNLQVELDGSGAVVRTSLNIKGGGRQIVTRIEEAGVVRHAYEAVDHLHSARVSFDDTGAVTTRRDFLPFGELDQGLISETRVSFTGQTADLEGTLINYGARFYDPVLARFLTPDETIPDPSRSVAYNRYAYAYQSPAEYVDPDGNHPIVFALLFAFKAAVLTSITSDATGLDLLLEVTFSAALGAAIGYGVGYLGQLIDGVASGADAVSGAVTTTERVAVLIFKGAVVEGLGSGLNTTGAYLIQGQSFSDAAAAGNRALALGTLSGAFIGLGDAGIETPLGILGYGAVNGLRRATLAAIEGQNGWRALLDGFYEGLPVGLIKSSFVNTGAFGLEELTKQQEAVYPWRLGFSIVSAAPFLGFAALGAIGGTIHYAIVRDNYGDSLRGGLDWTFGTAFAISGGIAIFAISADAISAL